MKLIIQRILALLYLGAMIISILILVKPGASIFYIKRTIDSQSVTLDAGFAYRYPLNVNPRIIRTQGILLYEDGQPLNPTEGNVVINFGNNSYSLSEPSQRTVYLYFSSSDNSNPITNERKYTLYLPLKFISRPMGIIYLAILLPGLVWFLVFAFAFPGHRQMLTSSSMGLVKVLDLFFEHAYRSIRSYLNRLGQRLKTRSAFWKRLFTITILIAYLYIFMEWLFMVTMPPL